MDGVMYSVSCSASKVRHVVRRLLVALPCALLVAAACPRLATAEEQAAASRQVSAKRAVAQRTAAQRAAARAEAEQPPATRARGAWYGWQTLTADGVSLALFIAGGAEGTWRRRMLAGGVLGYVFATPIIQLVHRRDPQGLVSALARALGPLAAHGICDSVGKIEFDIRLGPNDSYAEPRSKGFYRSLDDQLGPDFGAGTVCAGLAIAAITTLDAVVFAYEPLPGTEAPRERRNSRSPRRLPAPPGGPRIMPKIMLDERGVQAGLLVLGTF